MKKVLALLLAMAMVISLAACGNETKTSVSDESGASKTESADSASKTESADSAAEGSDLAYVQDKGTLVVGITDFEPMDYKGENDQWIGFDADMATAFAKSLGVDVEFVEIVWDDKIMELNGKTIDCVWNGMTLTDEVTSAMDCSNAYLKNAQIVVVPSDVADQYQTKESLSQLNFAVETGSAGEAAAKDLSAEYTPVENQATALMEVAAGTSDAAIIDSLMSAAMVGEGTSYDSLVSTVELTSEEYGVGFRKGSDLVEKLNQFFADSYADSSDSSIKAIAEKYGVQAALIQQ